MIVRSMIEASSDAIPFRPTHSAYLACGAVVVSYWRQMSSAIFSCFSSPRPSWLSPVRFRPR